MTHTAHRNNNITSLTTTKPRVLIIVEQGDVRTGSAAPLDTARGVVPKTGVRSCRSFAHQDSNKIRDPEKEFKPLPIESRVPSVEIVKAGEKTYSAPRISPPLYHDLEQPTGSVHDLFSAMSTRHAHEWRASVQ